LPGDSHIPRALIALALLSATLSMPAFAQNCDTSFTVVNASGRTIMEIYFSPASRNNWGVDQLGTEVLAMGATKAFRPSPAAPTTSAWCSVAARQSSVARSISAR
jgi:hypothetical protein